MAPTQKEEDKLNPHPLFCLREMIAVTQQTERVPPRGGVPTVWRYLQWEQQLLCRISTTVVGPFTQC